MILLNKMKKFGYSEFQCDAMRNLILIIKKKITILKVVLNKYIILIILN